MDQNAAPESVEPAADFLNRSLFNASLDSSAVSTNCSPGGINPRRRESKSRAEKKRRDRINVCFQRMHQLLEQEFKDTRSPAPSSASGAGVANMNSSAAGPSPGAEKAEILEQMIGFVEQLKRERQLMDATTTSASTPERTRSDANVDDSLIKSYMSGYKKGIQNIFILIDRLCNESERLTKTELIEKIKKGYLDNADSTAVESREKLAAAAFTAVAGVAAPAACRPALGDLSNSSATPRKSSTATTTATATAAAALIELSSTPIRHQPPAKKRRAFREQQLLQLQPPQPQAPQYEPISPGPYEPAQGQGQDITGDGVDASVWRPW